MKKKVAEIDKQQALKGRKVIKRESTFWKKKIDEKYPTKIRVAAVQKLRHEKKKLKFFSNWKNDP